MKRPNNGGNYHDTMKKINSNSNIQQFPAVTNIDEPDEDDGNVKLDIIRKGYLNSEDKIYAILKLKLWIRQKTKNIFKSH